MILKSDCNYVIVRMEYVRGRYVRMSEIINFVGYLPTRADIMKSLYNDMKHYKDEEYVLSMGLLALITPDNIL